MSSKFKLKIVTRPADAPAPQPVNAGAQLGSGLGGQPGVAPLYTSATAAAYQNTTLPSSGGFPGSQALGGILKRERPDELISPTGQPPAAKRPAPDASAAPPVAVNKFKLTIKKPAGSALSNRPSVDTASIGAMPTPSAYGSAAPGLNTNNGHAILPSQPSGYGLAAQQPGTLPLPSIQQRPGAPMAGAGPPLTKAQQKTMVAAAKAQEKAQAKADRDAAARAKQAEADNAQQLAAVMASTFGTKIKLKVKASGAGPPAPGPMPPRPTGMPPPPTTQPAAAPAPAPAPGPASATAAAPRPIVKFKVKAPSLAGQPSTRPAPTSSAPFASTLDAAAAIQNMQNMLRDNPYEAQQPAGAGIKRGRARGAPALPPRLPGARPPGVPRPMVIKRQRVDRDWDEEFDPAKERAQRARLESAAAPVPSHSLQHYMEKVLEGVAKKDEGQGNVFKAPVTDEVAPNYSSIVKTPMCFDDMRVKLKSGAYPTWEAFEADLSLVFNNAQAYNAQGTFVHHHANYLRDVSYKYLKEAKKGNTNFRGVAAGITRKYISEWSKTHKPTMAARPMSQARPQSSMDLPEHLPSRPLAVETRQARLASGAATGTRERRDLAAPAPNYGRGHRQHANVSYAADLDVVSNRPVRGTTGRAARGGGKTGNAAARAVRAGDPDARRMAAVYVRRSEAEELRESYYPAVPRNAIPQAQWRGLAGGATAEGTEYAAGSFALRPMWPGALYPNLQAAVTAHTHGGASFQPGALPQDAYARSLARFARRCHPAVRRMIVSGRLAPCMTVEGLPDPPPAPAPAPNPAPAAPNAPLVVKPEGTSGGGWAQGPVIGGVQLPSSLPLSSAGAAPAASQRQSLPQQPITATQPTQPSLAALANTPALQQQLQLLAQQQGQAGSTPQQQAAQLAQLLLQQGLAPRAPSPAVLNLGAGLTTASTSTPAPAPTSLPVAPTVHLPAPVQNAPVSTFAGVAHPQPAMQAQAAPQAQALLQQQQQQQQLASVQIATSSRSTHEATPEEDEVSGSPLPDLPPASPT